ncbi:hypothetical protein EC973_009316 [Apophysomyces ossiformis]|uniref:Uncharacterized protein n=1 Tax=Apophysomyces ossiformis TaxID=679940 RepID=A0A8H7BUS1_9FUNG|nr:hypothetical protein EC973_009316 [Apophysomyces ossiformis]
MSSWTKATPALRARVWRGQPWPFITKSTPAQKIIVRYAPPPMPTMMTLPTRPATVSSLYLRPSPMNCHAIRPFSLYQIPFMLVSASKTKRRLALATMVGGISLVSVVLGPLVWITVLGVGSVLAWRTWSRTQKLWKTLTPQVNSSAAVASNIFSVLKSQVQKHHMIDQVRQRAIDQLLKWANTDEGRQLLVREFNVDHVNQLTFLPVHSMTTIEQNNHKQMNLEFWVEDDASVGNRGGACMVRVAARVNEDGRLQLDAIQLSAPGWHADEMIPLDKSDTARVIEGEFRNL